MSTYASESGHWYKADGTPCYTMVGANGRERPTTLRDARKLGLLPSVTGIISLAAAPGLERWKRDQVLLAALTLPRLPGELDSVFMTRVEQDSREQGKRAAERGEEVHGVVENHYRGKAVTTQWQPWLIEVCAEIEAKCGKGRQWLAEKSYAHRGMYGCRIDLHDGEWLLDIKTKDDQSKAEIYDEHCMQLAANATATGLPIKRHGILFVGRDRPWAELIEVNEDDILRGMTMFLALYRYWQAKTRYFPGDGYDYRLPL